MSDIDPSRIGGGTRSTKTSLEELRRRRRIASAKWRGKLVDFDGHPIRADRTPLRNRIEAEVRANGGRDPLDAITVMHRRHDPYRIDNPAGHRNGRWFKEQIDRLLGTAAIIHLRGLHYVLVTAKVVLPHNGKVYLNTDANYAWLVEHASHHARWLGYVDFERIIDERNAAPEIFEPELLEIDNWLAAGDGVELPDLDDAMPRMQGGVTGHDGMPRQPYRIIFIGEKVSLKPILLPIAQRVAGELILPTGELSDTLLYDMMRRAAADGRPVVVLYLSDFDPAGYHMPVEVARKVQAHHELRFPDLDIAVYSVALNYKQVTRPDLNLPSTPLKAGESRGDRWKAYWGREQTEIDALAALKPGVLTEIVEDAITPFWDRSLRDRILEADVLWSREADRALRAHPQYSEVEAAVAEALDDLQAGVEALTEAQNAAVETLEAVEPPEFVLPEAEVAATAPEPLYSSLDDWREATERLIAYRDLSGDLDQPEHSE